MTRFSARYLVDARTEYRDGRRFLVLYPLAAQEDLPAPLLCPDAPTEESSWVTQVGDAAWEALGPGARVRVRVEVE